jgi:Disaggregatase related repeat
MPTVTIGDNTTDTFAGTEDAMIVQGSPTSNEGTNVDLEIGKYGAGDHRHALIKFSGLSNISGPVTVSSATLFLYFATGTGSARTYGARRLLRNWVEAQATWNIYSTGNNWTTAGGLSDGNDRIASETGTGVMGVTVDQYYSITGLAADVEGWINGTFSNFGWHISRSDAGNDSETQHFWASEYSNDTRRPYLQVVYTAGATTPITVNTLPVDSLAGGEIV